MMPITQTGVGMPRFAAEVVEGVVDCDADRLVEQRGLDATVDDAGRAVVTTNAMLLRTYPTWAVTVEGHCDERGTAEYNLALGERRAIAVKAYLVSLGIAPDRMQAVSYGKEFPFDSGHDELAWAANRRAHFVITSN